MTLPTLILNPDGTTAEANDAALALLRTTLEQLRELPPGPSPPNRPIAPPTGPSASNGSARGRLDLGGEATVRRLDGTSVRVKFGSRRWTTAAS